MIVQLEGEGDGITEGITGGKVKIQHITENANGICVAFGSSFNISGNQ